MNRSQYSAEEYEKFSQDYQFEHKTSSPYFPQANGEAERAVRTVKELLEKNKDPHLALLNYHATPIQGGRYSSSELPMSRTLRTIPSLLQGHREFPECQTEKKSEPGWNKDRRIDSHHGARTLPVLKTGDRVWIPTRQKEGTVQSGVAPRSLLVSTEDGSELRRNRKDTWSSNFHNPTWENRKLRLKENRRDHQPLSRKHLHNHVGVTALLPLDSTSLLSSNVDF